MINPIPNSRHKPEDTGYWAPGPLSRYLAANDTGAPALDADCGPFHGRVFNLFGFEITVRRRV